MTNPPQKRPNILFLFSDTGGGHRSVAEAIIEALQLEFDDRISTQMVDIFLDIAPRPLNYLPKWYPYMVRFPEVWGASYRISNGSRRATLIVDSAYPYVRRALHKVIKQYPADMIVSLHPLANNPFLHALGKKHPPFITVVTDLATTHSLWYHKETDLCLVPTETARQRGLLQGLKADQIKVVGLPVADRFCQPIGNKNILRQQLGWPQDKPVVLLVGGGEGMGPLEKTALAIAEAGLPKDRLFSKGVGLIRDLAHSEGASQLRDRFFSEGASQLMDRWFNEGVGKLSDRANSEGLPITLVIVAGRNKSLKERLEAYQWPMDTLVYGFVHAMPDFMRAADILVTKAGPSTISEALNAGLPMILYSRLPGQEDGNVDFVVTEGVGVWAPDPIEIVNALRTWIEHPEQRERAAEACCRAARPEAAREIAHILASRLGI